MPFPRPKQQQQQQMVDADATDHAHRGAAPTPPASISTQEGERAGAMAATDSSISTSSESPLDLDAIFFDYDDSDDSLADPTYSPRSSTAGSTTSDSSSSTTSDSSSTRSSWRTRCALAELEVLRRDTWHFSRLPTKPPSRPLPPSSPSRFVVLLCAAAFVAVLFVSTIFRPPPPSQCRPHFEPDLEPNFHPMVRPSDAFALSRIAFQLPSSWAEWIALPPLGMSHWKEPKGGEEEKSVWEAFSDLQFFVGRGLEERVEIREEKRESWAADLKEIGHWQGTETNGLGWIRRQMVKAADTLLPPDAGRACIDTIAKGSIISRLEYLVDDISSHLNFELEILDLYLDAFSRLSRALEVRTRSLNENIYQIAIEAVDRRRHASDRTTTTLVDLLSDSENSHIALAREEYGLLTFFTLVSFALPPAMRERKESILAVKTHLDGLKERRYVDSPFDHARNAYRRLPTMVDLDLLLKEKHLNAQTIRKHALEWMRTHSLDLKQTNTVSNKCTTNPATITLPPPNSSLTSPRARSTSSPAHIASQLYHLVWTHPTVGAASWHWEGSGPTPQHEIFSSSSRHTLETALLYAGLVHPDPPDFSRILGAGERWEDYRYRIIPRRDGADVRVCWPVDYRRNRCAEVGAERFLVEVGLLGNSEEG